VATLKEIVEAKGPRSAYSVNCDSTVLDALKIMAEGNVGAVLVKEDEHHIVGIFTERDYARKGELMGLSAADTRLRDVMTSDMITVKSDLSADACMAVMEEHHIRHLPVVDDGHLVGIVSLRDLVDTLIALRETTIIGLENYILASEFAT
jgi:CBS domain-containing protein